MRLALMLLFIFAYHSSFAEYRVFTLLIENQKTLTNRQIESTLDPEQYITIFPLTPDEKITYVDTWMCKGRTDFLRPHCEKPQTEKLQNNKNLDRSPATQP